MIILAEVVAVEKKKKKPWGRSKHGALRGRGEGFRGRVHHQATHKESTCTTFTFCYVVLAFSITKRFEIGSRHEALAS